MEKWAFATSPVPVGLGLSDAEFWYSSHEEYSAKVRVWLKHHDSQMEVVAALRSDIWNSSDKFSRSDKKAWTPQDFGAAETAKPVNNDEFNRARLRTNMIMKFGAGKKSVLANLKGSRLPPAIEEKIKAG